MKEFVEKIRTSIKPLYAIVAAVVVVLLIVGGVVLLSGGDDDGDTASDPSLGFAQGDASQLPGSKGPKQKPAPTVRTGTLDEARAEGRLANAQARGTILEPSRVSIRVSAAPKQTVEVNWQLGCFKDRQAQVAHESYKTRTPDTREITLPIAGAKNCIATATAQLQRSDRSGRIKVAIVSG